MTHEAGAVHDTLLTDSHPSIALTPGEPAGIGPDLVVLLSQTELPAALTCVAAPSILRERAAALGVDVDVVEIQSPHSVQRHMPGRLYVLPVPLRAGVTPGRPDAGNAGYVLDCLDRASDGCRNGVFDALVTGPIHKAVINQAGIEFSGHTEYLASRCGTDLPVMMLVANQLRVVLVTTHLPLRQVSDAITAERLKRVVQTAAKALRDQFAIEQPRILVCGLNPHAGEEGYLGDEEQRVIAPVIAALAAAGLRVSGPVPADTAFVPSSLAGCDAIVTMFHDQGLPVLKALGFGESVNVTLGLPFVRTSVDHGTALKIAGTGQANAASLRAAIDLAVTLVARRNAVAG